MHSNPNHHVTEAINSYLNLSISPYFAVMLDGPWGSGKTHYVKEVIEQIESESRKVIHISLYGLTNPKQINDLIYQNLHPFLGSKKAKVAFNLLASVARGTIKYDLLSGDAEGELSVAVPKFDAKDFLTKEVDRILFFDDFERCGIDPNLLLGYINYFVEHLGLKVIIAVNESEILEASIISYTKIKEKVIGDTYKISPDVDSALKKFIGELSPNLYAEKIKNSFDLVKDVFNKVGYYNLRCLRQVLINFQRLYVILPAKVIEDENYFGEFLKAYLVIALENSNQILPKEDLESILKGKSLMSYLLDKSSDESTNHSSSNEDVLSKKHVWAQNLNIANQATDFWINLFIEKNINENLLTELINSHPHFLNSNNDIPNWIKLWWWYKLEQNAYDAILNSIFDELESNSLRNVYEVMHACCIVAELIEKKFITKYDEFEWIEKSKSYFKNLSGDNQIPMDSHRSSMDFEMGYAGLGYPERKPYFEKFKEFAHEAYDREINRIGQLKSLELINCLKTSLDEFVEYIENNMRSYPRYSLFDKINVDELILQMNEFKTAEEWRVFSKAIHNWFKENSNFSGSHLFEKLKSFIDTKLIETKGKIIYQGVLIFHEQAKNFYCRIPAVIAAHPAMLEVQG